VRGEELPEGKESLRKQFVGRDVELVTDGGRSHDARPKKHAQGADWFLSFCGSNVATSSGCPVL
jgi:hypothetical protein